MATTGDGLSLEALEPLVGEWNILAAFDETPPSTPAALSALDFLQRYAGAFGDDGRTIAGSWEICHDGETWEHDFDLTYEKKGA